MTVGRFRAMGTTMEVHADDATAIEAVERRISEIERRFSRFDPNSELSAINRTGHARVSSTMAEVLSRAIELRERTEGLVDPGVGGTLVRWGYDRSFESLAGAPSRPRPGLTPMWTFDGESVRLAPGTRLDLGGLVKGWACDQIVESNMASIMSAGGDLRSNDPWLIVEIEDDDATAAEVELGVGALATSSTTKRRWKVGDSEAHHIIDPRTQAPAVTPALAATVVARTAIEAEAAAKAVLLFGLDGLRWADSQPWVDRAVVIWSDHSVYANAERKVS